ncbi:hypothetical protein B0A52_00725 [Exophiala mesophila]|uniref:Uncharacterized protein n=1 Tax=Exophiala mesophila TaxID=212818 RepID=A0A438NI15_EXOME|nr:hypothetical protein B0A52_00725 [Exophiala mesophila]
MSAEQYGTRLLEEVHEESLEELLSEVRLILEPRPRGVLGIPELDRLLETVRYPLQQSPARQPWTSSIIGSPIEGLVDDGAVLDASYHRHRHNPTFSTIDINDKPATIELSSQQAASGKTQLLYFLASLVILPESFHGRESAVVWFDNDGRFSAARLAQILCRHLERTYPNLAESEVRSISQQALSHIHVFRPQSSAQLLSTLSDLASYLLDRTKHASIHRPLGMIVLDPATAFYWQDRFEADMAQLEASTSFQTGGLPLPKQPSKTANVITQLKALQARFGCTVMYTTMMMHNTSSTTASKNSAAPPLSPWNTLAALTLQLRRVPVPQFAPQMSLEQCLHDADRRLEVVRRSRFSVSVAQHTVQSIRTGGDRHREGNIAGGGDGGNLPGFVMRISKDGVFVEE